MGEGSCLNLERSARASAARQQVGSPLETDKMNLESETEQVDCVGCAWKEQEGGAEPVWVRYG